MATYTITTAVNIDSLASKVGSDTYNINGGYLTVDQHTRYGTNQNTSAAMGNLTLSATLGGTVEFNSTKVRLIPYDTGSSTVPAYGTTISQGSASAILLCVYSDLTSTPTAVGAAMPASGYILVRQWNSISYTTGALTGIGASATAADGPGWLEIVGTDALLQTCNRLGTYKVRGDYYYFQGATTDGSRTTTYQIPSNGSAVYVPGVEVETAAGSDEYEFYPCAGTSAATAAVVATDEIRGRWCWISTAGLVRFGHDGTNSTGGFCPESGRKIRVPNIFFVCCASADKTVNTVPHATLATRMEFATTGGGVVDMETCCVNWYLNCNQPYSLKFTNVSTFDNFTATEIASPIAWSNVGVGQSALLSNYGCLMSLSFAGGTMDKCTWTRCVISSSGNYIVSWTDITGITVTNQRIHTLEDIRGNASTGAATLIRVNNSTFTDCLVGGGRVLMTTCTNVTFTNTGYYDHPATTTISTIPMYMFDLGSVCSIIKIDGIHFNGLTLVQPYNGILSVGAAGCTNIKLRNLGTYASPLDLGGPRQDLVSWSRSGTTATATLVAHGLKTGDIIYVPVSSVVAAITVAAKTVASVPTADTFTFTCLNAGATSGTISYFPTMCANLVVFATGAAANDIKIQRCYTPHTRTNLFTGDNSSTNVVFENVISDYVNPFTTPILNTKYKGVSGTPTLAAQAGCYGTHWMDVYTADITPNLTNQSWSRSGTTVTVTSTDHKLRTGLLINVNATDNSTGVPLGSKSITVLDANTFTFTGVSSGTTSGVLSYRTVIDRLVMLMNEQTTESSGHYTDLVGTASFTSAGTLSMPSVNDSITFQMTYYRLGFTGFPINELVMGGGTIANYNIFYKIDVNDGNGDSSWRNAYYTRSGASGTSGQFTFTVTDASGVEVGDYVWGTGIGGNAKVTDVTVNTITVDVANSATVSGILRFNHLRSELGLTSAGIKLTVKIVTTIANASGISYLIIYADSDDTSRALQYPLDTATLTINGLVSGSDVVIMSAGTETVRDQVDTNGTTSWDYDYSIVEDIDIAVFKAGYIPYYIRGYTLTSSDSSVTIAQIPDRAYLE